MQSFLSLLCKLLFKLGGWSYHDKPELWQDKQVVIGFPHTTNMDGLRSLMLFMIVKIRTSTMVKKELFKGPMGVFLRSLGFIPIDRKSSMNVVDTMSGIFAEREKFTLVVAPEGTRSLNRERTAIKTGFWRIAKAAGVPIVLMVSENSKKRIRMLDKLIPSESMVQDLIQIQKLYADVGVDIIIPD